jgi:hypothetical protein
MQALLPTHGLTYLIQPCPLSVPPLQLRSNQLILSVAEVRITRHNRTGSIAGARQQILIEFDIKETKVRQTMLSGTKEIAHSAQPQVGARDLETVFALFEDAKTLISLIAAFPDQDTVALIGAAAYAAAQLMEL